MVLLYRISHRQVAGSPILFPPLQTILFPFHTIFSRLCTFVAGTVKSLSLIADSILSFIDHISFQLCNLYFGKNVQNADVLCHVGLVRFLNILRCLLCLYCL